MSVFTHSRQYYASKISLVDRNLDMHGQIFRWREPLSALLRSSCPSMNPRNRPALMHLPRLPLGAFMPLKAYLFSDGLHALPLGGIGRFRRVNLRILQMKSIHTSAWDI